MRFMAFDLEISTPIPAGAADWSEFRPFGISCAVTQVITDGPVFWYGDVNDGDYLPKMTMDHVKDLVVYLSRAVQKGFTIVTFNGCGFDFSVLAEESGMVDECKQLAMHHVDLFFFLFCRLGYAPGLDRLAKGMDIGGKPEGVNGALAPQMWLDGQHQEVLDYCAGDVRMTLSLAQRANYLSEFEWLSKSGKAVKVDFPKLLTVAESLKLPEPDISWMGGDKWERSKFTGWMGK